MGNYEKLKKYCNNSGFVKFKNVRIGNFANIGKFGHL